MADYIERETALGLLHSIGGCDAEKNTWADGWDKAINAAFAEIEQVPAADVAPVRHGKWIRHEKEGAIFADYECSICSSYPTGSIRSHYCPNCGAKMDKK